MVLRGDAGLSNADSWGEEVVGPFHEAPPEWIIRPTEDFPLEQSRDDTLRSAFDQDSN